MAETSHNLTHDELVALSDTELAVAFVDLGNDLAAVDSDLDGRLSGLVDALDGLVAETLERLSPEAGRTAIEHHWKDDSPDALRDALDHMRRRAAARVLRDVLGEDSDG
jgi:hypothetical protein